MDNSLSGVLYHQYDLAQLEVLHDALCGVPVTPADVPADMLAEVELAIAVAKAPPREPASEPKWLKDATSVPCRMFADEACTVEILPDANGQYWTSPDSGGRYWVSASQPVSR